MFKQSNNPVIEELTKSWKKRSIGLQNVKVIKKENGDRFCVWCANVKLLKKNQKYCSPDCVFSACAWAYPHKFEGLFTLLVRQDWKCNICFYDWKLQAQDIHNKYYAKYKEYPNLYHHWFEFGTKYDYGILHRLKNQVDSNRRLEVDHIIPIYKGGQSIGLDNCQILCYLCHKIKTSKDLSKSV